MTSSCFAPQKVCVSLDYLVIAPYAQYLSAGDIHIWDRESGALLHHVRTSSGTGGDLTCIAWNHAAEDPFMFATGSHDGGVRIWTRPLPRLVLEDTQSVSQSGAQTPRSRTPSIMDVDYRTESPFATEFQLGQPPPPVGGTSLGQKLMEGLTAAAQTHEEEGSSLRPRASKFVDDDDGPGLRPRKAVAFTEGKSGG